MPWWSNNNGVGCKSPEEREFGHALITRINIIQTIIRELPLSCKYCVSISKSDNKLSNFINFIFPSIIASTSLKRIT